MTYAVTNPPALMVARVGGSPAIWTYASTDVDSDTNAGDYYSNGDDLGMVLGDMVYVFDTATPKGSQHYVSAVTAGGAATTAFAAVA